MTTYLGKSCSFCLPRVPFVNCRQFMYLVISLLVLRAGYGIWLYQFLIIAYLFTLATAAIFDRLVLMVPVFRLDKKKVFEARPIQMPTTKEPIHMSSSRCRWSMVIMYTVSFFERKRCFYPGELSTASYALTTGKRNQGCSRNMHKIIVCTGHFQ